MIKIIKLLFLTWLKVLKLTVLFIRIDLIHCTANHYIRIGNVNKARDKLNHAGNLISKAKALRAELNNMKEGISE